MMDQLESALARATSSASLVPGDITGIVAIADYLRFHASVLSQGSGSLSRVEVTSWRGSASNGFHAAFEVEPGRWSTAARAFGDAATAMDGYAASLGSARDLAAQALQLYREYSSFPTLAAATQTPTGSAVAGVLSAPGRGTATRIDPLTGPVGARESAIALLGQAISTVSSAGDIAADLLRKAMAEAPPARRFYEQTIRPAGAEEPAHLGLDVLGMVPLVGTAPDLVNAGWYATEDRNIEAGLSLASAVPGVGDAFGGGIIVAKVGTTVATRSLDRALLLTKAANEVTLGRGALDATLTLAGPGRLLTHVPYGFGSRSAFDAFSSQANKALLDAGATDAQVYLRGSSMTGYRYATGETIALKGPVDLDLAVVSPKLLARARLVEFPLRGGGTRSMPLYDRHLALMGLPGVSGELTKTAGRDVSVMIYASEDAILARGDAILLP